MDSENSKILIVDDEMINIKVLVAILDDYECLVAKNGEKALELIGASYLPDLILLDVLMPGLDGYEVCRRLKANPLTKDIPVIFITSKRNVEEETYGLNLGAADYITKPFSPEIVRARATNQIMFKKQQDMLRRLNVTDHLTGIPNRRCFEDTIDYECRSANRSGSTLSLIMMDIDNFKRINDLGGHVFGDTCLKEVACTLRQSVSRSIDLVARFGGDEFAALLPYTEHQGATKIAEVMRQNIEALNLRHSSLDNKVSISLGVFTALPDAALTPDLIIERADKMLYQAKESGRNRVCS